jgi:hypothetical protein
VNAELPTVALVAGEVMRAGGCLPTDLRGRSVTALTAAEAQLLIDSANQIAAQLGC